MASAGSVDPRSGYRTVAAEQLAGQRAGQRGVGACRETCVPQARAPSGVVVAATSQGPGAGAPGGTCRASAGACKHAGMTAPVDQRVPALLEELDRYPDDRAEIVRAAWAWNLMTSRWPGVVEPARHVVVVHAAGVRASAVRPRVGCGWSGCR